MGKLLRINTREKTLNFEKTTDAYAGLGGRALTSKLILDEVPATCHPLGKANKLIFAPGILAGSPAADSGRLSAGAKSPLTGGIKESNAGGLVSQKLARLGITAIILEDKPETSDFSLIVIDKDGIRILPADDLVGKGNYAVMETLWEKYGKNVGVLSIGQAGEQCLKGASIQQADMNGRPGRAHGRGGLGAVMGAKKIKAIVVDDKGASRVEIKDKEAFKAANKKWVEMLRKHPVTGEGLPALGTAVLVNVINEAGAFPTKNFRSGQFEHAQDISGEKMAEIIEKRGGVISEPCHPGCVIKCSNVYNNKEGKYLTSGFEYETIWAFGAHTTIKELDDIAMLDRLCDDFGLDTIEMGVTLGVAMDGGMIPWGDGKAAIDLLSKIGQYASEGKIIGNGAGFTGDALGLDRIPIVKNQALPAYDPRSVKGVGVTYATTPMGADHTAGYGVTANILSVGGTIDPHKKEGNIELSQGLQIATAAVDAAGLCLFVAFAVLDNDDGLPTICEMLNAQYGLSLAPADVLELGKSILNNEKEFNRKAGFTKIDDRLPEMFYEKLPPHDTQWDFTSEELSKTLNF
ncbi:aldehyde ferredoxin oxidoreductase family protein [Desulfotignum phosphitoxidans]|uniref:Tungsten-containing aldehyde ferredoxin oxidoreductase Aor n=1 Tax=Desulfotignum phosphitoxidans DSM 13687 TaxID=1286635 RepID=S0G2B7_9BACT|nr:aldehyde ferredoxin oxidoreductase C-terminal domain-containing protein [Desulfotignum phosphitoxidans]EMS81493.1 tungsten-containing aldehyde ferredoxin oxidoreductase Aor [Desulfotignum phosphitoxidans DSM 13687]